MYGNDKSTCAQCGCDKPAVILIDGVPYCAADALKQIDLWPPRRKLAERQASRRRISPRL